MKLLQFSSNQICHQAHHCPHEWIEQQHTARHRAACMSLQVKMCRQLFRQGTPSHSNGQRIDGHNQNRNQPTRFFIAIVLVITIANILIYLLKKASSGSLFAPYFIGETSVKSAFYGYKSFHFRTRNGSFYSIKEAQNTYNIR